MSSSSFQLTRWSMIRGAGASSPQVRQAALERLCSQYWHPLYAYLRRRGRDAESAADTVQGLFAKLLESDSIGTLQEGAGRFRNWLLTALQNHERDERDRDRAAKRGGGWNRIPIDPAEGEQRLELLGSSGDEPEAAFERAWAMETLRMGRDLLEQEMRAQGKGRLLDALVGLLDETDEQPRAAIAADLGVSAVTLRVSLHRLRNRYRELLATVVADSIGDRAQAGDELQALSEALSKNSARTL